MPSAIVDTAEPPRTIIEMEKRFRTEEDCRRCIEQLRWPEGFRCVCGSERAWSLQRGYWKCAECARMTSVTAGTVFHGSHLPLTVWFRAIWLVTSQRTGISALELQHSLGLGSYRTAWAMLHSIREIMQYRRRPLHGHIDVGIRCFCSTKRCRSSALQSTVVIAVEEKPEGIGRVRMRCIAGEDPRALHTFLAAVAAPGSMICPADPQTSALLAASAFPAGNVSRLVRAGSRVQLTMSLVKRWLDGTHQGRCEAKYLQLYLEEFSFRFNRRNMSHPGSQFLHLLTSAVAPDAKID